LAIAKKGSRKITVQGETFLWRVRKKTSHEEWHDDQYGIPIQHESNGQLLIAYVGYCRSDYPNRESVQSITPAMIENCITEAINLGWKYSFPGKPISLLEGKLQSDTRTAKWSTG